jgi:hypothetical protein
MSIMRSVVPAHLYVEKVLGIQRGEHTGVNKCFQSGMNG